VSFGSAIFWPYQGFATLFELTVAWHVPEVHEEIRLEVASFLTSVVSEIDHEHN
jgi:hypothetical protein